MKHTIKYCLLLAFLLSGIQVVAFPRIERRIVIDEGRFWYLTADDETQLATLHEGKITAPFMESSATPLPIGRETAEPYLPLAFDIHQMQLTGINWILNPMNSRFEAIRSVDIRDWKQRNPVSPDANILLQESMLQPSVAPFVPWQFMRERNNVLHHMFFDLAVINDSETAVAICNQGELMLWIWNGRDWLPSSIVQVDFRQYFTLLVAGGKIAVAGPQGDMFVYDRLQNKWKPSAANRLQPGNQVIVTDKDLDKIYTIESGYLETAKESLQQLLKKHGRELVL